MKQYELSIIALIIVMSLGAIASYVSVHIYHRHDAPLEQFAEEMIKDTTGISVDFTPSD